MNNDRLVDDMALAIVAIPHFDDGLCIYALIQHGFRAAEVTLHVDEAIAIARQIRADIERSIRAANHA